MITGNTLRRPVRLAAAVALLGLACSALRAQQTCEQLPKGIAGWWPGDGSGVDLTSAANSGSLMNGVAFASGIDGQGFALDGVDDRVDIPDAPALRPSRFTLSAWIRLSNSPQSACILCKQFGSGTANSYSLWINNGVLQGGMYGYAEAVYSGVTLPANQFLHAAVSFDGSIIRLYLDGRLVAATPGPASAVPYDANPLIIGVDDNGVNAYQGFFSGTIDEAQIFGRALTGCEIQALFRARDRGECKGDFDGDLKKDFEDNCPTVANASQLDGDADGAGDVCDCAPSNPLVYAAPGEFSALIFAAKDLLSWCEEPTISGPGTVYDVIRGNLGELPVSSGTSECRSRCSSPPSGLVAWWPGDGTTTDLVGGLNGTLQNGASLGSGLVRQAFAFDGIDDRVLSGNLPLGNTFAVAAWVNSAAVNPGGFRRIVETSFVTGFYLGNDAVGTGYKFIVRSSVAPYGAAQGGKIVPGEWQFLVGTYDGATGTLYVNGTPVASDTFTPPGTVSLPVNIGAHFQGGFGWNGRVDEVQVFNRALSAAEVRALYDSGSAGQCKAGLGGTDSLWTAPWAPDGDLPTPGHGFWYLFRGNNACGSGSYGSQSNGTARLSNACN